MLQEVLDGLLEAVVTWVATWEEALERLEASPSDLVIAHLSGTAAIACPPLFPTWRSWSSRVCQTKAWPSEW
jgi:hypothetical protein